MCRILNMNYRLFIFLYFLEVRALYNPGIIQIELNQYENSYSNIRSFFGNSSIIIKVNCIEQQDFYFHLLIDNLNCLPVSDKINATIKQPKQIQSLAIKCSRTIEIDKNEIIEIIENEGLYIFSLNTKPIDGKKLNYSAKFEISMKGPKGYLSKIDWPFLPFYATMCVVYSLYAIFWLILCAIYWRDILRIQFWIGGVIALGMFEKAMFLGELDSIRRTGFTTEATIIVAEIISSLKRALARMLVIIACLGFGIVKPRLGEDLHKVTIIGCAFFIFSCIEGVSRSINDINDPSMSSRLVLLMLAIIDAIICFWILLSITRTIKLLYMRKNEAKLSLYRHFRNTLIAGVFVSTVFLLWNFFTFTISKCYNMWRQIWFVEAIWHVLFSTLLLVIIILWRPSANNQRYAYSAVYDIDEEEIVQDHNEALGDVKKIKKNKTNASYKNEINNDEDLKWVDEHIPSSLLDVTIPSMLDSDEEIDRTRIESSKLL